MANILVTNNFYQGTSSACIVDLTPPTFSGITGLDVESRGQIRANWSSATDATSPIRYEVYIKASTSVGLFSTTNIISVTPNLQYDIFTMPDGSFLQNGVTYFVGVRAIDGVSNRDSNTVSMSVISTGVLTSIDTYSCEASWSINNSNQFQIVLWANKNDSLAKSPSAVLGAANFQIYKKDGTTISMSETNISANASGLFVSSLINNILNEDANNYQIKVGIVVDGEERVNFIPLMNDEKSYDIEALFFINNENEFDGTFYVHKNGTLKTTNLGVGSYQVYDHDGQAILGMSESGIVADVNGIYKITHVTSNLPINTQGYSVKFTVIVDGVTRSKMITYSAPMTEYKPKAQFSINALNQLQATFWVEYDSNVETSGLGTASYQVYDVNGNVVVGLNQTGIVADMNGRFHITPVSATLLTDLTHYSVKVSVMVHGIERVAYKGFTLLGT